MRLPMFPTQVNTKKTALSLPFSLLHLPKGPYPPQSAPREAPHDVSNFVEGSGPIFPMYLEMATEEDKTMAENWKADADGILIFVRLFICNLVLHAYVYSSSVDRFILCCCRIIDLGVNSGCSTEPTRHLQFLPLKQLPGYSRS